MCLRGQNRGLELSEGQQRWSDWDLPVSPVFDLQQVTDEAVPGTALDEVSLSRQEGLGGRSAVFLQEVVEQRQLTLFLHLVEGDGVHHRLDHPRVRRQHQDLIGFDPEGYALLLPDGLTAQGSYVRPDPTIQTTLVGSDHVMVLMSERYLELLQHLEGEQLLSQVVSTFHDDRQQPPVRKVTVRRSFSDPPAGHGPGGKGKSGQNH